MRQPTIDAPTIVAGLFAIIVLFVLAIFSLIIAIPIGALCVAGFYWYKHMQAEKLRTAVEHVPATIRDRPPHPDPDEFSEIISGRALLNTAEEDTDVYSCEPLAEAFETIVSALYAQDSFHQPPEHPDSVDAITIGRYHDQLGAWQRKVSDKKNIQAFVNTLVNSYLALREHFPTYAFQLEPTATQSYLTTPLIIEDEAEATKELVAAFYTPDLKRRKLFVDLRNQLEENFQDQQEFSFSANFAKTPFRMLTRTQIPLILDDKTRFAGMWVCGPQGTGKTTLLHALIAMDLEKDASLIICDSKGELIRPLMTHPALAKRRVIIGPDNPVGLNPLEIPKDDVNKAVDNLEYLFASILDFKLTPTQSMLLKAVFRTLVETVDNPSLEDFRRLLGRDGEKHYASNIAKLNPDLQEFFASNTYNGQNIRERRLELLQRLRALLDHDVLRSMLMAPKTTFRLSEAMDQGAVVIIDNSRGKLGNKGAEFLGRFFVMQVLAAAQQRSFRDDDAKKPVYFYIDEAHTVVKDDERITDVYHECRSQKIALCCAHQETSQVSERVLSAFQNSAIRFAHPDDEVRKMSGALRMDARTLHSLKQGQFGAYIRGLSKQGIVVNVRKPDLSVIQPRLQPYQPSHLAPPALALESPQEPQEVRGRTSETHRPPETDLRGHPHSRIDVPSSDKGTLTTPAAQHQTKPASSSQPETSEADRPVTPDPGEPSDNW